jgi:hypothetical protein
MDGAFPSAKGEGFEVSAEYSEQRKGFRGNAENAKTKLCMRWAPKGGLLSRRPLPMAPQQPIWRPVAQVEEWALPLWRSVQLRTR